MVALNSPGKHSMPGCKQEQSRGAVCGAGGKVFICRGRERGADNAGNMRIGETEQRSSCGMFTMGMSFQKASSTRSSGVTRSRGRQPVHRHTGPYRKARKAMHCWASVEPMAESSQDSDYILSALQQLISKQIKINQKTKPP